MDLVINDDVVVIDSNTANYIMHVGFSSVSVSEKIDTAKKLVLAIEKILNPYINGNCQDYKDMKSSNFHFYSSIIHAISGVEIVKEEENKSITIKFKGTEGTIWA